MTEPTLVRKLAAITKRIAMPKQSGENKYERYKYSTKDDVFETVRRELADEGIVWIPQAEVTDFEAAPPTSKGVAQFRTRVSVKILFCDGSDELVVTWPGESVTNTDRGASMATTQAVRMALINMFMLMGTDPDPGQQRQQSSATPQRSREELGASNASKPAGSENAALQAQILVLLKNAGCEDAISNAFLHEFIPNQEAAGGNNLPLEQYPPQRLQRWLDALSQKSPEALKTKAHESVQGLNQ